MFRRLGTFVLVLACAFAPALPAVAAALTAPAERCSCGNDCCRPANCPPPAPARAAAPVAASIAVVSRAVAPRVASRSTRALFVFVSPAPTLQAFRTASSAALATAASVPLFTEHCSLLL